MRLQSRTRHGRVKHAAYEFRRVRGSELVSGNRTAKYNPDGEDSLIEVEDVLHVHVGSCESGEHWTNQSGALICFDRAAWVLVHHG